MSNENDGTNKEEIENNEDNYLPQNTILFQEDKENKNEEQEEIFKSVIFTEMVKEHKKHRLVKLKDLSVQCIHQK